MPLRPVCHATSSGLSTGTVSRTVAGPMHCDAAVAGRGRAAHDSWNVAPRGLGLAVRAMDRTDGRRALLAVSSSTSTGWSMGTGSWRCQRHDVQSQPEAVSDVHGPWKTGEAGSPSPAPVASGFSKKGQVATTIHGTGSKSRAATAKSAEELPAIQQCFGISRAYQRRNEPANKLFAV